MSTHMRAAVYTKAKSGKVLELKELEQPIPKDNEVLIHVRAASVNPLDWRMKSQRPGVDAAGEVAAVGKGVTRFKPGEAVFGVCRGAFAEYACGSEDKLVPKPEGMSFEQAAAIPIAGLTALQAVRDKGHLETGQKVLVNGASGGLGTFTVQIAKSFGASVTGVCSTRNLELVRSLGADRVLDYTRDDFSQDGERYDLLVDNVGNRTLLEMGRVLSPGGKCVMTGAPKETWQALLRLFKGSLIPKFKFFIAKVKKDDLLTLSQLFTARKVVPTIDRCYPLTEAGDAIAYVEGGHARAKVVIVVQ